MKKKTGKFTSHDLQNELLKVMALSVLRDIADNIRGMEFFSIMLDECTDVSNEEQASCILLCLVQLLTIYTKACQLTLSNSQLDGSGFEMGR